MQLSKNFYSYEFVRSDDFPDLAAKINLTQEELHRARYFCLYLLQPGRNHIDEPMIILSGKRSEELNKAVGGHINSDHLFDPVKKSLAVDVTAGPFTEALWTWLTVGEQADKRSEFYKILIYYPKQNFIHMSAPDESGLYGLVRVKNGN